MIEKNRRLKKEKFFFEITSKSGEREKKREGEIMNRRSKKEYQAMKDKQSEERALKCRNLGKVSEKKLCQYIR